VTFLLRKLILEREPDGRVSITWRLRIVVTFVRKKGKSGGIWKDIILEENFNVIINCT
jgi:hypothetical protein